MMIKMILYMSLFMSAISIDFGDHAVPQPLAPSLLY